MTESAQVNKIDQYAKAQHNTQTNTCLVYARDRAVQYLGNTAWHQCDQTCNHLETCRKCVFAVKATEDEHATPQSCILASFRDCGLCKTTAHEKAKEHVRGG